MKNSSILIILLFLTSLVYSQNKINPSFVSLSKEKVYFNSLKQEKFFLHTNKTTYFTGEKIWFKAYIVDDLTNTPFIETTNIYANLYNSKNKLISSHLFYVENGVTHGEINIDENISSGKYYIQLETLWSQNFVKKNFFTVEILNPSEEFSDNKNHNTKITDNLIDIQFFPEGHVFLAQTLNNIVVSTKKHNIPTSIQGEIIEDDTQKVVSIFKTNDLGVGTFKLYPIKNKSYTAKIIINGNKKNFPLPVVQNKGIVINKLFQKKPGTLSFMLKTNLNTIELENGNTIYAIHHRKAFRKSVTPIKLNKKNQNYIINYSIDDLYNGVNTITIFNQLNTPIAQRSFYWERNKIIDLKINQIHRSKDSVTLNLNTLDTNKISNISISVLPSSTKAYNNSSNILSSFLTTPYLSNITYNPTNLLDVELDSLNKDLLIQTYSTLTPPILPHKKKANTHESGKRLNGVVNTNLKELAGCRILLSSRENNLLLTTSIDYSKSFSFNNLLLQHPTKYKLGLLNKKGKIIKASFYIYKNEEYRPSTVLKQTPNQLYNKESNNTNKENSKYFPIPNGTTILEEVTLEHDNSQEKNQPDPNVMANTFMKAYKIDQEQNRGSSVLDYINTLPGVRVTMSSFGVPVIKSTRGPRSLLGKNYFSIYLNNHKLESAESLKYMDVSEIETVHVNASGAGYGLNADGGVIELTFKYGDISNTKKYKNPNIKTSETEFGFSIASEKFENNILNYGSSLSKLYYSSLDWIPEFMVKPNTSNYLKIHTGEIKDIKLIINGINNHGDFIYKTYNFTLN
ncbi:MAG: hypothetical protein COA88_03325 [Kordia sp.]|nr:MAG: hypothetical protein COA88_03325 [Kordia sp.]